MHIVPWGFGYSNFSSQFYAETSIFFLRLPAGARGRRLNTVAKRLFAQSLGFESWLLEWISSPTFELLLICFIIGLYTTN